MYDRIVKRMRERVLSQGYIVTLHARREMNVDGLSIYDLEQGVLTGNVVERQKDRTTGEWKYRVRGESMGGNAMELVAKFSLTGKLVIITVYLL